MPYHRLAATQVAEFLPMFSHPRRLPILDLLRETEQDVATSAKSIRLAHSSVWQHLIVMRAQSRAHGHAGTVIWAHRVVIVRREGRRDIHRFHPMAWLTGGCQARIFCRQ